MNTTPQTISDFLNFGLTLERIRIWGIRSGLSVLDQGLTSGCGFLLNLLLARWLTSHVYGAFAVAFATLLFLSGYHNVLLLEPMSILGPARYSNGLTRYFRLQLKVHAVLMLILSGLLLLASAVMMRIGVHVELTAATAGSALALPFLLFFWLTRRMCYVVQRPSTAAWASASYLLLITLGLFALHAQGWLTPFSAFLLMGIVSLLAGLVALRVLGVLKVDSDNPNSWKHILRENWNYGRWLVASTTLFSVASQTQTYLAAAMIGLGAAGILRAMQLPSLVMTQIVTAIGLLVLPTMSYEYGRGRIKQLRKQALLTTLVLTFIALGYAAALALLAKPIEDLLFQGKFSASTWLIPTLALVPVFTGFAMGFSMALRACQKPHFDLLANAVSAPVGLITALVFIKLWGLGGAAFSLATAFAAYALVFCWSFNKWTKEETAHSVAAC